MDAYNVTDPDEGKQRKLTVKMPLDDTGNLQDIGPLNGVNWFSERFGFEDVTIEMVSHEMQTRESEARCEAIAAAEPESDKQSGAEIITLSDNTSKNGWVPNCAELNEPATPLLVPDLPLTAFEPHPVSKCYTTRQVARKLGLKIDDLHNLIRRYPQLSDELGKQQHAKNHNCYYLKSAVNEYVRKVAEAKKNGLVLAH